MRARQLATQLLEGVLVVGVAFEAVLGVLRPLLGPGGLGVGSGPVFGAPPTVDVTIDAAAVRIDTDPDLPVLQGGPFEPGGALEFTIPTGASVASFGLDLQQRLGLVGSEVLTGLVSLAVLVLLLGLVRSLRQGDPFVAANARRLYAMAAAVGIGGQLAVLLHTWGRLAVLRHPRVEPYVVEDFTFSYLPALGGLGIAVAAEVFRRGTELRREVEALV